MRRFRRWMLGATLTLLAACEAPPFSPTWNADLFFPLRFPDVMLQDYASAGFIPPTFVSFTTPLDSEVIEATTQQIFEEDLNSLKVEFILSTGTDIDGYIVMSVAASQANLFSSNSALALTDSLGLRKTAGDTASVQADVSLFRGARTLYFRSRGRIRSATGGFVPVGPNDQLTIGLDVTANVKVVK